jgi:hypothetical protein
MPVVFFSRVQMRGFIQKRIGLCAVFGAPASLFLGLIAGKHFMLREDPV